MNGDPAAVRQVPIAPFDCLSEGWNRVRDQYWLLVAVCAVGMLIGGLLPLAILMGPMLCGIYVCCLEKWRGRRVAFELLFKGFDSAVFLQSLIASLIQMAVSMVVVFPVVMVAIVVTIIVTAGQASGRPPTAPGALAVTLIVAGIGILLLGLILISTVFVFTYPLIVDRGLTGVDAIKLSLRASLANFWGLVGLALLTMVAGLVGVMCCYVGAFLVLPITFGAYTAAYVKVFGLAGAEGADPLPAHAAGPA
jgi:hypothetical protein